MKADLAIINGLLVDSRAIYPGVLYMRDGKIVAVTQSLENRPQEMIDAHGLYILPGAIDGHVHMMDPGYTDREDFTTGTRAAARGGVTTVIDHTAQSHRVWRKGTLEKEYLKTRSIVDFGLLGGEPDQSGKSEGPGAGAGLQVLHVIFEADALGIGNLIEILEEIEIQRHCLLPLRG
jgi:dihydroorotase/allantoinase